MRLIYRIVFGPWVKIGESERWGGTIEVWQRRHWWSRMGGQVKERIVR